MARETLHCKDFRLEKKGWYTSGSPSEILPEVNQWIAESCVRVISLESLFQNGGTGVGIVKDFVGVRVWYVSEVESE